MYFIIVNYNVCCTISKLYCYFINRIKDEIKVDADIKQIKCEIQIEDTKPFI